MKNGSVKKLAIIFPGMGYHKDKPLLYYSCKIAKTYGYELIGIEYHDMPQKIQGDMALMKEAALRAYACAEEQLSVSDLSLYNDILLIGKSIGTVVAAKYNLEHKLGAKQLWYTPVEATFNYAADNIEAFIGDNDPWSDISKVKELADISRIPLFVYPGCNHSLESGNAISDLNTILDVMEKTEQFITVHRCETD